MDNQLPYLTKSQSGLLAIDSQNYDDEESAQHEFSQALSALSTEQALHIVRTVLPACGLDRNASLDKVNGVIHSIMAMKPSDPLEAQLIAQAVVCSQQALELISESNKTGFTELKTQKLNLAMRLMRLYNQQIDTLGKYRRKGHQSMHVEHLHVGDGNQVSVGPISQTKNLDS